MPNRSTDKDPDPDMVSEIGRKAARRMRARNERRHGTWFGLGMFGLIGWSIAVPLILGIAIGQRLDAWLQDRFSWTLTMLFVGLALGCVNAWYWMRREVRDE